MAERYQIKGTIGRGGIGAVYRAFDTVMGRDVAIKRLLPIEQTHLNESADESLKREASALARLSHPNILTIYAFEEDEEGPYVVTELVEGEDLKKTIERGALPLEDFAAVVEQTLEPLIAAHTDGVLHRDIKPANIMLHWLSTGKFQIKILDFGLAKFSQKPSLQTLDQTGSFLGSIDYIAPEQIELKPLDFRADLYSLGCVLYYTLLQRPPFADSTPAHTMRRHLEHIVTPIHELRSDLPEAIADWVMRLLSLDPNDRPANAATALREFADAQKGISPTVLKISPSDIVSSPQPVATAIKAGPRTATGKMLVTGKAATLRQATAPRSHKHSSTRANHPISTKSQAPEKSLKIPIIVLLCCIALSLIVIPLMIKKARASKGGDSPIKKSEPAGNSKPQSSSAPKKPQKGAKRGKANEAPIPALKIALAHANQLPKRLPEASSALRPALKPPVVEGLIGHYRSEALTFREDLKTPAQPGDAVAAWGNLADQSAYHYLARVPDLRDQIPILVRSDRTRYSALNRDHLLLQFSLDTGLRVRSDANQSIGLDQQQLTFFMLCRSEQANGHIVKFDGNNKRWNFMFVAAQKNHYQLSIRKLNSSGKGAANNRSSIEQAAPIQQFVIVTGRWNGSTSRQTLRIIRSSGDPVTPKSGVVPSSPVELIGYVLGNPNSPPPNPKSARFAGLIAAVLIYDRALDDSELRQVEDYLHLYYFRKS